MGLEILSNSFWVTSEHCSLVDIDHNGRRLYSLFMVIMVLLLKHSRVCSKNRTLVDLQIHIFETLVSVT